jgi:hypothetical protein
MFKLSCALGILFATIALFKADAQTQRPPMADFLLNQPVSLMDWAMMRAQKDIDRAVERLNKEVDEEVEADPRWRTMSLKEWNKELDACVKNQKQKDNSLGSCLERPHFYGNYLHLHQFNYKYSLGYAGWSKDQQRIVIGAAVRPLPRFQDEDVFTASGCTDLLQDVKAGLLSVYGTDSPALLMEFWFDYNGSRWRVGDFDQIVAITNIEVKLSRSGGDLGIAYDPSGRQIGFEPDIECSQALNGGPATIHDHRQKK